MRVLLTCEDYLPQVGGAEICVFNVARELRDKGHSAMVYTNTLSTTKNETHIVRVPWSFTPSKLWKNITTLWKLIGENDIAHCTYSFRLAAICAVLCKLRGKPMLLTQQGKGIVPEVHPKFHHALLVKLCQHVSMRLASHITSTSDEITDLTAAFVPRSKITLVSNGYDAQLFSPDASLPRPSEFQALSPETKVLLTVRRLVPKNGIHILVQALALVKAKNPNFRYFAIGEGRSRAFIEELIREGGLEKHVTLLGSRENDTVKPYYQHADLVLMPSSAEARSITCIEAMGMGKPIIASRVGGLIDLMERDSTYGELVTIYDSEACTYDPPDRLSQDRLKPLVEAILLFLEHPEALRKKAELARQYASQNYSWSAITQQYESLYVRVRNAS